MIFLVAAPLPAESFDAPAQLCAMAGEKAECVPEKFNLELTKGKQGTRQDCPSDWSASRKGDCWTKVSLFDGTGEVSAYVHPDGWVIDPRCFADSRFTGSELISALTTAALKMDPERPSTSGGCMGEFNPEWGAELKNQVWDNHMHVSCPDFDETDTTCASHEARPGNYHILYLKNVRRCMGFESSGLAGVLFHETLHAAGADNFRVEKHNKAWELEQWVFVSDRVYGTEAVCFFGFDPKLKPYVNLLQCRNTVNYHSSNPRRELCDGFSAYFTNMRPMGFIKH